MFSCAIFFSQFFFCAWIAYFENIYLLTISISSCRTSNHHGLLSGTFASLEGFPRQNCLKEFPKQNRFVLFSLFCQCLSDVKVWTWRPILNISIFSPFWSIFGPKPPLLVAFYKVVFDGLLYFVHFVSAKTKTLITPHPDRPYCQPHTRWFGRKSLGKKVLKTFNVVFQEKTLKLSWSTAQLLVQWKWKMGDQGWLCKCSGITFELFVFFFFPLWTL